MNTLHISAALLESADHTHKFIFQLTNNMCRKFPHGGDKRMFHIKEFAFTRLNL